MPRGDLVEPVLQRLFQKAVEFHEVVAEDIRIRGESFPVSFVDVAHDTLFVLLPEIEGMERESEILGNFPCFFHVGERRAIFRIRDVVDHETARNLMPRFTQKVGDNGGVHSARESYEDFGHVLRKMQYNIIPVANSRDERMLFGSFPVPRATKNIGGDIVPSKFQGEIQIIFDHEFDSEFFANFGLVPSCSIS